MSRLSVEEPAATHTLSRRERPFQVTAVIETRSAGGGLADGKIAALLEQPGSEATDTVSAARIFDCCGIWRDPEQHASPLIAKLLGRGRGRNDSLRIGLDADGYCLRIDREKEASRRLIAIGPPSRADFWEIMAIPDIREQSARLGETLSVLSPQSARPLGKVGF